MPPYDLSLFIYRHFVQTTYIFIGTTFWLSVDCRGDYIDILRYGYRHINPNFLNGKANIVSIVNLSSVNA